jgi:hypothetical protein
LLALYAGTDAHRAGKIGGEDLLEDVDLMFFDALDDAGAIDDEIQSVETLDRLLDRLVIVDIQFANLDVETVWHRLRGADANGDDASAMSGQFSGDTGTDARRASGHQRGLSFEQIWLVGHVNTLEVC